MRRSRTRLRETAVAAMSNFHATVSRMRNVSCACSIAYAAAPRVPRVAWLTPSPRAFRTFDGSLTGAFRSPAALHPFGLAALTRRRRLWYGARHAPFRPRRRLGCRPRSALGVRPDPFAHGRVGEPGRGFGRPPCRFRHAGDTAPHGLSPLRAL